jgi:hypothetical protein
MTLEQFREYKMIGMFHEAPELEASAAALVVTKSVTTEKETQ